MPKFELKVYPEPKDGTYCGGCDYRGFHHDGWLIIRTCGLFGEDLDVDEAEGAHRCDACIEAERGASNGND